MKLIKYRKGYKYQLAATDVVDTTIHPKARIMTEYIHLATSGRLLIKKGYAWDGPSGPAIDTKNFMRGSLIHDALYQLMREKHLDAAKWRETADRELQRICKEDGMSSIRAWWVYQGVRFGGGPAATDPDNPILTAP